MTRGPAPPGALGSQPVEVGAPEGAAGDERGRVGVGGKVATYVIALGDVNTVLYQIAPDRAAGWRVFFASAMLWLSALPALLYAIRPRRQLPYLPCMTAVYFIYFGLPVFLDTVIVQHRTYDVGEVTTAVGLALAGEAALLLTFYTPLGKPAEAMPNLTLSVDFERLATPLLAFSTLGMMLTAWTMYGNVPIRVAAIALAFGRLPLLVLCGMFLLYLRGRLTPAQALVSGSLFMGNVLLALGKGALAQVMYAIAPPFLLYVWERGRIPYLSAVLAVLLVIPFMQTKMEYRYQIDRQQTLGVAERIQLFVDLTYDGLTRGGTDFAREAATTSNERTSHLGTFSFVVHETPRRIPYWDGETYAMIPWGFVPRVIAPDKPTWALGQQFGHRYGLLHARDDRTAFNTPQLTEMYINFGVLGVLLGMSIVGLYYRAMYRVFNHDRATDAVLAIGAVTFTTLLNIESGSPVLVGAPQNAVVAILFFTFVSWLDRKVLSSPVYQ